MYHLSVKDNGTITLSYRKDGGVVASNHTGSLLNIDTPSVLRSVHNQNPNVTWVKVKVKIYEKDPVKAEQIEAWFTANPIAEVGNCRFYFMVEAT